MDFKSERVPLLLAALVIVIAVGANFYILCGFDDATVATRYWNFLKVGGIAVVVLLIYIVFDEIRKKRRLDRKEGGDTPKDEGDAT